eukprot:6462382-Amphidinium_carterae.1
MSCCWIVAAKRLRYQVLATPDSCPQKRSCEPNLPDSLASAEQEPASQRTSRRNAYAVLGLAKVKEKTFYDGVLTQWDSEDKILFEAFSRRRDCVTHSVTDICPLPEPLAIASCISLEKVTGKDRHLGRAMEWNRLANRTPLSFPAEVFGSGHEAVQKWMMDRCPQHGTQDASLGKCIPMVLVPEVIAKLIMQQRWKTLPVLGAWCLPRPRASCSETKQQSKRARVSANHRFVSVQCGCSALLSFQAMLSTTVERHKQWRKFPAVQAVRGVMAAWNSRNKHSEATLRSSLRDLLLLAWPGSLGQALATAVDGAGVRLPSRSSLQRWMFSFDACLMWFQRQRARLRR